MIESTVLIDAVREFIDSETWVVVAVGDDSDVCCAGCNASYSPEYSEIQHDDMCPVARLMAALNDVAEGGGA